MSRIARVARPLVQGARRPSVARAVPSLTRFAPVVTRSYASVAEAIDAQMDQNQRRNSLRTTDERKLRWNNAELGRNIDAVGAGFVELDFAPGSRVVVMQEDVVDATVLTLGAAKAGVTLVPIPSNAKESDIEHAVKSHDAKGLIVSKKAVAATRNLLPELKNVHSGRTLDSIKFPSLKFVFQSGWEKEQGFLALRDLPVYKPVPSPLPAVAEAAAKQALLILAKGEKVDNSGVTADAKSLAGALSLSNKDRVLLTGQGFTKSHGAVATACCSNGAEMIVPASNSGDDILSAVKTCGCTVLHLDAASAKAVAGAAGSVTTVKAIVADSSVAAADLNKAKEATGAKSVHQI
eukprot:GFYU01012922.1.p1 GENE.GFYU01012922.1~~GFYU01012922.1.p1  ORF type:complete len:350 (-),score=92.89 GFYU01012922.1:65-1114(-)